MKYAPFFALVGFISQTLPAQSNLEEDSAKILPHDEVQLHTDARFGKIVRTVRYWQVFDLNVSSGIYEFRLCDFTNKTIISGTVDLKNNLVTASDESGEPISPEVLYVRRNLHRETGVVRVRLYLDSTEILNINHLIVIPEE